MESASYWSKKRRGVYEHRHQRIIAPQHRLISLRYHVSVTDPDWVSSVTRSDHDNRQAEDRFLNGQLRNENRMRNRVVWIKRIRFSAENGA